MKVKRPPYLGRKGRLLFCVPIETYKMDSINYGLYTTWRKCNFPLQSIHKYWPRRHNKLQILLHNFQMLILVDPCILESRMKLQFLTSFSLKSLFYLVLTLSSKTCSISLTITNRTTYGTCTKTFVVLKLSDNWHGFILIQIGTTLFHDL